MGRIQSREQALQNILDMDEIPPIAEFPKIVKLPPTFMDSAAPMVTQTEDDARERSINFRYKEGEWQESLELAGRGMRFHRYGTVSGTHYRAYLSSGLYRPHILLHTHPSPAISTKYTELLFEKRKMPIPKSIYEDPLIPMYMLPSWPDVEAAVRNIGGTVGNIVASTGGNVLLLRPNARVGHVLTPWNSRNSPHAWKVRAVMSQVIEKLDQLSVEEGRATLLKATSQAVAGRLVCYFSDDPASAELQRVDC